QQLRDELAERDQEQYIDIQPADNPKRIAPFESAEPESTATPRTLPKPKRVRKNPSTLLLLFARSSELVNIANHSGLLPLVSKHFI
ncbi:hypothetical protein GGF37_001609, partial [Kickxella alabastrina]